MTERAKAKFQQQTHSQTQNRQETGKTHIHKTSKRQKRKKPENVGEYIEYEEID